MIAVILEFVAFLAIQIFLEILANSWEAERSPVFSLPNQLPRVQLPGVL